MNKHAELKKHQDTYEVMILIYKAMVRECVIKAVGVLSIPRTVVRWVVAVVVVEFEVDGHALVCLPVVAAAAVLPPLDLRTSCRCRCCHCCRR